MERKIILIEDDQIDLLALERLVNRIIEKHQLKKMIVEKFSVSSPAMKSINSSDNVALIVCDTYLPDMDAIDIMNSLAKNRVSTPILLVSGVSKDIMDVSEEFGVETGRNMIGSLSKPISLPQLEEAFHKAGLLTRPS